MCKQYTLINTSNTFRINQQQQAWERTYTNGRDRVLDKEKTKTFYFKNVRLTDIVGLFIKGQDKADDSQ